MVQIILNSNLRPDVLETLSEIYDVYSSAHHTRVVEELSSVSYDSWASLCELIDNYKKWLDDFVNSNSLEHKHRENFLDKINGNFREYILIKSVSNIEVSIKEYIKNSQLEYFPELLSYDNSHDNFKEIRKGIYQSLKDMVPQGKNPSFNNIQSLLGRVGNNCKNCFTRNFKSLSMSDKILNKIIFCRNSIAHGDQNVDLTDELFLFGIIYSFEVSKMVLGIPKNLHNEYIFESSYNFNDSIHKEYEEQLAVTESVSR